jgi:two-component system, NarL family, nitrate/nitrite response regulator NarL
MTNSFDLLADRRLQLEKIASLAPAEDGCEDFGVPPAGPDLPDDNLPKLRRCEPPHRRFVPTVIVDKSSLLRAGLAHVLSASRFRVVAMCESLTEVPARILEKSQCMVLLGLDSESWVALEQIPELKSKHRDAQIVVLAEVLSPATFVDAIEAGCDGWLIKNETSPDVLLKSLELLLLGGLVIPRGCARLLRARPGPEAALQPAASAPAEVRTEALRIQFPIDGTAEGARLSEREQLILSQLMRGLSNKRIARELNIAEATVKVHVKSLLRKTRVRNRTQAAIWGVSQMAEALPATGDRDEPGAVADLAAAD